MKRLALAFMLLPLPAFAQAPPKTIVLSAPLVEEMFQRLSTNSLIMMLQAEVQHQPGPVTCPDSKPMEPPDAIQK
jgi:hypothetical protein